MYSTKYTNYGTVKNQIHHNGLHTYITSTERLDINKKNTYKFSDNSTHSSIPTYPKLSGKGSDSRGVYWFPLYLNWRRRARSSYDDTHEMLARSSSILIMKLLDKSELLLIAVLYRTDCTVYLFNTLLLASHVITV